MTNEIKKLKNNIRQNIYKMNSYKYLIRDQKKILKELKNKGNKR